MYKIMIIDDDRTSLIIAKKALENDYDIIPTTSGNTALDLLKRVTPDLILLDINMPKMNGFEFISRLKTSKLLKDIPIIFLTAQEDSTNELEGLSLGAVDYIKKPFSIPLFKKRIALHIKLVKQNRQLQNLVKEKTENISKLESAIMEIIAELIAKKENCIEGNLSQAQYYFSLMLKELMRQNALEEITEEEIDIICLSSKLYDIGKIGISDKLLLNAHRSKEEEIEYLKSHTIIGADSIQKAMTLIPDSSFLKYAWQMARSHHEKWDGTGYPDGLSGKNIPFISRILAVADVYDTLISPRNYREAISYEQAIHIIIQNAGSFFDPKIVSIFQTLSPKMKLQ